LVSDSEALSGVIDTIADFSGTAGAGDGDVIDLSALVIGGNVIHVAGAALTGLANEFGTDNIAVFDGGVNTIVYVDVNTTDTLDAGDIQITLSGTALGLVAADFVV